MNKKILFFAVLFLLSFNLIYLVSAEKPEDIKLTNYVNDYAGILTSEQNSAISKELEQIFKSGEAEVAILTVRSLDGMPIEDFSYKVAEGKLGDATKNNGLLILIAVEDRKYRFEVGRGLEPIFNDAKITRIGRTYLVPSFKQGDYYTGLYSSTLAIKSVLLNDTASEYYVKEPLTTFQVSPLMVFFAIFILISLISALIRTAARKKKDDNLFFAAILVSELLKGGGKGGFGGGGFGGFGGGSFGGGGGGGSW